MSSSKPTATSFSELLRDARKSALKLELRDSYLPHDPAYLAWLAGDQEETYRRYAPWPAEVSGAVARGVEMRRVRVVSEPVSDYIRFEHEVTARVNLAGGEQVRWLPRSRAWDLLLPACDLWVVDERVALLYFFSAEGESAGSQVTTDSTVVDRCVGAFAAAWECGIDHAEYHL